MLNGFGVYLALPALGLFLAERSVGFEPIVIGRLVALKLVLRPAVTGLLVCSVTELPTVWAKTALLMSALPTGTGPFILSKLYEREAPSMTGTIGCRDAVLRGGVGLARLVRLRATALTLKIRDFSECQL